MPTETFDGGWGNFTGGDGTFANEDNLTITGGHLTRTSAPDAQITWAGQDLEDGIRCIKFRTASTVFGGFGDKIRLILKTITHNQNLYAFVHLYDMTIGVGRMNDWGTFNEPLGDTADAGSIQPDTDYWLHAEMVGNEITVGLYDADPIAGSPTALAEAVTTLAGADATDYGDGVALEPGLNPPNSSDILWYDDFVIGAAAGAPPTPGGGLLWPRLLTAVPSSGQLWPRQ